MKKFIGWLLGTAPIPVCRKHWFGQGIGEGPCLVCGTVTTFNPTVDVLKQAVNSAEGR